MNTHDETALALALDDARDDVRRAERARAFGLVGVGLTAIFFILMILWPSVILFSCAMLALAITSGVQMYKSRRLPVYRKLLRRIDVLHTKAVLEQAGAVIEQWPGGMTTTPAKTKMPAPRETPERGDGFRADEVSRPSLPKMFARPVQRKVLSEKSSRVEVVETDVEDKPAWARKYIVCRPSFKATGYEITDPHSQPELVRVVKQIVAIEGPLHRDRLVRRTRETFMLARSGTRVRAAINQAVSQALREGAFEARGEFLGKPASWQRGVRVWDRIDIETRRTVEEVPLEELRLAMQLNAKNDHFDDQDELLVSTARIFGWARVGPDIRARLGEALA